MLDASIVSPQKPGFVKRAAQLTCHIRQCNKMKVKGPPLTCKVLRPDGVETQQLRAEAVQREKTSVSFPCGVCAIKVRHIKKGLTVEEQTKAEMALACEPAVASRAGSTNSPTRSVLRFWGDGEHKSAGTTCRKLRTALSSDLSVSEYCLW